MQKKQLEQQLDAHEVADRVRRLQGKETAAAPVEEVNEEEENDELFKKYITSPGLKEKNLNKDKNGKEGRISQNTMIALALLTAAFIVGIAFGTFNIDLPGTAANANLFTNDSAFPPFVLNNTTNTTNRTNMTNMTRNTTKIIANTTKTVPKKNNTGNGTVGNKSAAGEPGTTKNIST